MQHDEMLLDRAAKRVWPEAWQWHCRISLKADSPVDAEQAVSTSWRVEHRG